MAAAALAPIGAKWDRRDAIALARPACTLCAGRGMVCPRARPSRPCNCVLRAIFRACLERYRNFHARPAEGMRWGWKHLDYCADFELAARRELDALDYQVFPTASKVGWIRDLIKQPPSSGTCCWPLR